MTSRHAALLVFHGALLLLIGNLVGFPFASAIEADWGPEAVRAWRVAHTSLVLGGALYVAMGAARSFVVLPRRAASWLVWLLVSTAYVFPAALVLGASIGARGLSGAGPPLHVLVFVAFTLSVLAILVASVLFLWGTYRALRHGAA
jgi:hypothetical protein